MRATEQKIETKEAARRRRKGTVVVWIVLGLLLFTGAAMAFFSSLAHDVGAGLRPDTPAYGVGRTAFVSDVPVYAAGDGSVKEGTALCVFSERDDPLPAWWDPDHAEIVYQSTPIHADALDYNLNTTLCGWDGHGMEVWEMDLFARIVYLEFWGTSQECTEAGIDSMLLLWDMGEYGRTMGELLSAQYKPGKYVYSPYPYVWEWKYDAQGLADIRAMCEERFAAGPTWCAPYFRLWYYHEWAVPAYQIDGVYFSVPRG